MTASTQLPQEEKSVPFTTYVVKVVSRCNLNCEYCYMYNLADRSYRDQPGVMLPDTTRAMCLRIASHARRHGVPWVHIILHGGEPLMMGRARLAEWVGLVRTSLGEILASFSIQSNGTLIDDEWIDLLAELQVRIGISVDGPKVYHDMYRVDHKGRGSFDNVISAIRTLQMHPRGSEIFSCVMSVVNPDIPPKMLFEFWQFLDVPGFDLSLPHANHLHPPRRSRMSYGEWLRAFFDLWFDQNRPDRSVRYFENILRMLFGYPVSTDNIGGKPVGVVVVETDGGIEPTDAFKCCEEGVTKLGLNVHTAEFDDLYGIALVETLQRGTPGLCASCQACELNEVCGGGYMPHRYSRERGFDNPSIYCDDLQMLIRHIRGRVLDSLPPQMREAVLA
ncbi:radical SAM protein [Duganella violaceipulchra]|uniref:Radical SAM protein n=1 Tax=Duganella violaceipulchra TaxID=2849652 RepID=A0AA41L328_9BURK|nr:radical SAM protein [Duganella violaceicalia]MBV6323428.1 radical SAM protein [Duganella violaceicalia]MCP2007618.1 uncharacterized protein [Duganella violaceicalia]